MHRFDKTHRLLKKLDYDEISKWIFGEIGFFDKDVAVEEFTARIIKKLQSRLELCGLIANVIELRSIIRDPQYTKSLDKAYLANKLYLEFIKLNGYKSAICREYLSIGEGMKRFEEIHKEFSVEACTKFCDEYEKLRLTIL